MRTIQVDDVATMIAVMEQCHECFLGIVDADGLPYVVPMCFGYADGEILLHSAPEGFLLEAVQHNPNVCITFCTPSTLIHQHPDVACSYRMKAASVICRGRVEFVPDDDLSEKMRLLDAMMDKYVKDKSFRYSEPSLRSVKVWRVRIESISCKRFGVHHPNSRKYNPEVDAV